MSNRPESFEIASAVSEAKNEWLHPAAMSIGVSAVAMTASKGNVSTLLMRYPNDRWGLPTDLMRMGETSSEVTARLLDDKLKDPVDPDLVERLSFTQDHGGSASLVLVGTLYVASRDKIEPGSHGAIVKINSRLLGHSDLIVGHKAILEMAMERAHEHTEEDYIWPGSMIAGPERGFTVDELSKASTQLGRPIGPDALRRKLESDERVERVKIIPSPNDDSKGARTYWANPK